MEHNFYHGTSSFFLRSINKYGLGGINPNEEWKLFDLLKYLYELSELKLQNNKKYLEIRDTTRAMAFQKPLLIKKGVNAGTHNFNHKNIYLSYGILRAIVYAINNEYGSEILTRIIALYRLLINEKINVMIPAHLNTINIEKIERERFFPILIGIDNVDSEFLLTEYGEPADKCLSTIYNLKKTLNEASFFERVQLYNFRLLEVIPKYRLNYYRVLYTGKIGSPNFTYNIVKL